MPVDAIVAAVVGALSAGATETGKKLVGDAYEGLKGLIKKRFGETSEVSAALEKVEAKPESDARKNVLREELESVDAGADAEMLATAEALLAVIRELPQGEGTTQTAHGKGNVMVSGPGATTNVHNYFGRHKGND